MSETRGGELEKKREEGEGAEENKGESAYLGLPLSLGSGTICAQTVDVET